jgi:hypothetical protein
MIFLQDENNHNPIFDPTSYVGAISEIDPAGLYVYIVQGL